jgi:hypothetical protein
VFAGTGAIIIVPPPPPGGGGEWVIWQPPDFPANRSDAWQRFPRPGFRRPSRSERRGY